MKRWMIWFLTGLLVLSPVLSVVASDLQDAKDKKTELEKKQEQMEATRKDLESKKSDIMTYIASLDGEQQRIAGEMDRLEKERTVAEQDLAATQTELEEAKNSVASQYDIMKRRIKYMYENGSSDYFEVLLQSKNLGDLLNQAEYMSKIAEYDNELLGRFEKAQAEVEEKEKEIETQLAQIQALTAELELEQQATQQLAADKALQVEEFNRQIAIADGQISEYDAAIEQQDKVINDLIEAERKRKEEEERRRREEEARMREEERKREEERRRQQNLINEENGRKLLNGGLIWPMPSSTRITSGFGSRAEVMQGSGTYHYGVDIGAAYGSNIIAAASGTVVEAGYHWSMGNYVLIDHGSNIFTVYMHSSRLLVSAGATVDQGDVIALVGSTGLSTGPHLHFGLKVNGSYVNPLNYVSY